MAQAAFRTGLRGKVLAATAVALLTVVVATAAVAAYFFVERQTVAQVSRSRAIADALAIQLERILAMDIELGELQGFDEQCDEALARHGGLSFAMVLEPGGAVLFRSQRVDEPPPALPPLVGSPPASEPSAPRLRTLDGSVELALSPVFSPNGARAATVVVGFPLAALRDDLNTLLLRVAGIGLLVVLLVLGALWAVLSRVLVRPLGRIVDAVEGMRQGDAAATVPLEPGADDEITVLAEGFNGLARTVAARERELVGARDDALQASRAKSQFLAVMSHELRTPLNAVLGLADVLARTPLDKRQQRLLAQVRSSGRSLADIISDLLDFSSIEAGKLRVVRLPFVLRDTVRETVDMFRDEAASRGIVLTLDIDPTLPEHLVGDALRTRQVLTNLLGNALKFTAQGSVRVVVAPTADDHVRLSVADTGTGIAPEFLPHIYEAFRQADSSSTRRFAGNGLGLTIAQQLCMAMQGRIDVRSQPGEGSTFWFDLPMHLPALAGAPASATPDAAAAAAPRPAPDEAESLAGLEVLVVEDSPTNREFMVQCLAGSGARLTVADDGLAGLARVRAQAFDLVLMDWQMPGMDGLAVLAMLREIEQRTGRARSHVVAVTAHAAPGDREACLAAGADDYLAKPFTPTALQARLAPPARRAHLARQQADRHIRRA